MDTIPGSAPRSDFLFARPSWLSGLARLVDIFGVFDSYNRSRTGEEADARAQYTDWCVVGHDLHVAYEEIRTASGRQGELFPSSAEA
jgi:hypothetical protein